MGSCDFSVKAKGKTPQAAFNAAVDQAAYDHGHGGYTGTIAEKSSFVMIHDTPATVAVKLKMFPLRDDCGVSDTSLVERLLSTDTALATRTIPEALMELEDDRIDDKWGPAGCVQTGPEEYIFFGWASS